MGNYFSRKTKKRKHDAEITEVDKAVLSLKTQRRKLNGERKRLEVILEKTLAAVKELVASKQKDKALLALKKKKMREAQLKNLDNWMLHVEQLLSNIEMSQQQNAIFAALRSGADALKSLQEEVILWKLENLIGLSVKVKVEDVDKLTEDTEEAKAYLDEIHQALGMDSAEDIAALEDELAVLESQMEEEEKLNMPSVPILTAKVPEKSPEEEEIREVAEIDRHKERRTEEPLIA